MPSLNEATRTPDMSQLSPGLAFWNVMTGQNFGVHPPPTPPVHHQSIQTPLPLVGTQASSDGLRSFRGGPLPQMRVFALSRD